MKASARAALEGEVVGVGMVWTRARVRIDIGKGKVITAPITNHAGDELGLKAGREAPP